MLQLFNKKQVHVSAANPAALQAPPTPETPPGNSGNEAALLSRIQSITAMAADGQERLGMELLAAGKNELEAAAALNADLRAKNAELKAQLAALEAKAAEPQKPEISKEEVVAALLQKFQAAAPQMPPTASQGEPNVYEQYKSIENPAQRQSFYAAHKAEIDAISNNQKKEAT